MPPTNVLCFPASFAQQRLWFIDQDQEDCGLHHIPAVWRLSGALDVPALQKAVNELVRRHETLRTVVRANDQEEIVQLVAPGLEPEIKVTDLSGAAQPQAALGSLLQAEVNAPFHLSQGPLVRCGLITLAAQEHVLMLTMHHIVSDGWSMGVLARELQVLYSAFAQGRPSPLPDLPIQYADYAVWQREWMRSAALQSQLEFWRKTLGGAPPLIELPLDRPRPAQLSHHGAFVPFELDATSTGALLKLCQQAQVTAFMATAALLNVLLHRYSRQDDICIGYTVAGRQRKELEGLIGFFVNTLVLRTRVEPRKSFLQLLSQVRESVLAAADHQDLPFEKLVEELKLERSLNHSPLFQVMLAYNNAAGDCLSLVGVEVTPQDFGGTQTRKFDLTLELTEAQDRLLGTVEYNSELFDSPTIERMVGHFKTLLEAVVANPQSRVHDLPLLTEAERHQILVEWNDTKVAFPRDKCIHQLFEEQVERSPDAPALVFEDQQLTYAQLNAKANQLAHHLRELGVKPDMLVAICVERNLWMVIGLLGTLKAGGAYVPLDPDYPGQRLEFMLQDSAAPLLLTQAHLKERLPRTDTRIVCLDSAWDEIGRCAEDNLPTIASPLNLAYCIYTSGSTGKPKAVGGTHIALCNRLTWAASQFPRSPNDRHLQKTSLNFVDSITETCTPLIAGSTLCIAPQGARDPDQLCRYVSRYQISHIVVVPSLLKVLLLENRERQLQSLRQIVCSGESLRHDLRAEAERLLPSAVLVNLYGSSEVAGDVTFCTRGLGPFTATASSSIIGHPISNTRVYLLDASMLPAPVGVPAAIYVGGIATARGYLGRPDLTAANFIPDPYSADPGARMYSTGDLGRYRTDGSIEYLGRIDHQVKVRGFRIELGEVEAALRGCEAVRDAAALVREDGHGDNCLAACVVPASREVSVSGLREHLSTVLPEYMVPTAWAFLDALPLNPNGKIDRRVLESSAFDLRPQSSADHDGGEIERKLLKTWRQVLGRALIGIHDNFFEIGGHSLNVVRLRARILQDFGVSLSLVSLLKNQTVSAQAAMLKDIGADEDSSNDTNHVVGLLTLTPAQERFLVTTPAEFLDTNTLDFLLECKRERRDVVAAIRRVVSRHTAFRISGFVNDEGLWRQVVASQPAVAVREFEDVRTLEPFLDMCRATGTEISLTNSAFYRWCVCSGPGTTFVYFSCHHLIADAISLAAIKLELDLLLSNGVGIEPPAPSSVERWIDEHSAPQAMIEYYQELPVWERHTSRSRNDGCTVPAEQGSPARDPVKHTHVIPVSRPQIDNIDILAVVAQAFSQTFQAETVQCRVVDSGRGASHSLDDSTTVGWLAHHIPLSIPVCASLRGTAANTRAEIAGLARRGLGYGWLRYKEKVPALCSALQLTELPLYFNHLYADSEQYSTFTDITDLLPRDRKVDSEPFRGLAIQVLQSDQTLDFTVSFDGEHIGLTEVEKFINALGAVLEEFVSEVR